MSKDKKDKKNKRNKEHGDNGLAVENEIDQPVSEDEQGEKIQKLKKDLRQRISQASY